MQLRGALPHSAVLNNCTPTISSQPARFVAAQAQVAKETRQIAFHHQPQAMDRMPFTEPGLVADGDAPLTACALQRREQ